MSKKTCNCCGEEFNHFAEFDYAEGYGDVCGTCAMGLREEDRERVAEHEQVELATAVTSLSATVDDAARIVKELGNA